MSYSKDNLAWLGTIPDHWQVSKLRQILSPFSEKNHPDMPLLSVVREKGVIIRNVESKEENHNYVPDDLSNYKLVKQGQFTMNKMKAWQGSYGVSKYDGIVSPAYFVFNLKCDINRDFFNAAIRSKAYVNYFGQASDGIRVGQWDLSMARMKDIPLLVPPREEQDQIVRFLNWKVSNINKLINIKKKEIKAIDALKRSMVSHAITRGLATDAPMKDSGVKWLGDIPAHWNVTKLRQILHPVSEKNHPEFPLLSVVREQGVILRDVEDKEANHNFIPDDLSGYKVVRKGQFAMNKMKAWQGSYGVSDYIGIVSPAYFKMKEIPFIVPPADEQIAIVKYIKKALPRYDAAIEKLTEEVAVLEEYKNKIIADTVTGKIDVRSIEIPEYEFVDEYTDADNEDDGEEETEEQED